MSEDLQALLERIRSEGVEKADAEAKAIVNAAKAEAEAIRKAAADDAARIRAEAKNDAAGFASNAEATVRQAMRDVRIQLADDLQGLVVSFLGKGVAKAMADESVLRPLVAAAVKAYIDGGDKGVEVALGGSAAKMAEALKAEIAAQAGAGGVAVEASPAFPDGFTVRIDGGRVEQCFTTEAVTEALTRLLRPELAKLAVAAEP